MHPFGSSLIFLLASQSLKSWEKASGLKQKAPRAFQAFMILVDSLDSGCFPIVPPDEGGQPRVVTALLTNVLDQRESRSSSSSSSSEAAAGAESSTSPASCSGSSSAETSSSSLAGKHASMTDFILPSYSSSARVTPSSLPTSFSASKEKAFFGAFTPQ